MAGGDGGYVLHMHCDEPRELTLRECASIQGFPTDFHFSGKPLDVAKQIVNAVPVQLAHAIAMNIVSNNQTN
jgi:DNA (cytosine-5)-methyltransferase 1